MKTKKRSDNPTKRQQRKYWLQDLGLRVNTYKRGGNRDLDLYVPMRKRGEQMCPPMNWRDICRYVQGFTHGRNGS